VQWLSRYLLWADEAVFQNPLASGDRGIWKARLPHALSQSWEESTGSLTTAFAVLGKAICSAY